METTEGGAHAVERAAILDSIMSEATAIDDLQALVDALAEMRPQRRLESAASGSTNVVDSAKVILITETHALWDVRERTGKPAH